MALSRDISDHKEVQTMVEETKRDIALLKSESPPTYEGSYVGSSKCQSCHSKQYDAWQRTPHAHAYQTLKNENRNLDYDCYSCHVTGAFDKDGNLVTLEQSKIDAARVTLDSEAAAIKYKTDRTTNGSTTYDTIGNQLDMLYADMIAGKLDTTGTWATHIKAVKDANPKPS